MSSAWRKFTQRRTTARRSTNVAVDLPLFARIFLQLLVRILDGVERLFGHDKAPSKCLPQQRVEQFCFSPLALLCPIDGSFIHHCLYFFYKFSQFRAAIEVAEQPPNKRRRNSSFLVNRWKLMPSFRCLSYLLQPKAQQKTVNGFQRRRPTRLTVSRTQSARSSRRSKAMELSTREKADTESGRVLPNSSARKKFRESLHLHMSTSVEIFVRPATDQCKS